MIVVTSPSSRFRNPVLYGCFFASGAAGLLYEVLWSRILGLTFGYTVYAVTTVLAAFMAGLALGGVLLGRYADRCRNPLRLYAILEIGIGAYCLAAPSLLSLARHVYLAASVAGSEGLAARMPVQFALAFGVLVIPATLMGGTLPAVARALVTAPGEAGKRIGFLYGINTLGAALGAFAAGYGLLPSIGLSATNVLGVALNLSAGAAMLLISRGDRLRTPAGKERPRAATVIREESDTLLLWAFAASGALGMTYQIVWFRSLVLVIGSSTYAFSAILVTFLAGIAIGSFLYARMGARLQAPDGPFLFAVLMIGIGTSAFLLVPLFDRLPRIFFFLFRGYGGSFGYILGVQFLIVFLVVLIPTTLMGMTFPCLAAHLARRIDRFGSDLGALYAWNTVGAIAGSVAAGFLLVPSIGAYRTLTLAIGGNVLLGAAILLRRTPSRRWVAFSVLGAFAVALLLWPPWDRRLMNSGVFHLPKLPPSIDALIGSRSLDQLFFREGISSTVSVVKDDRGVTALLVNGKADANNADDMETQVNLANVPMLLHPSPRRIAVLGLGSGVTAGTAALYPETIRIDIVEIEPAVVAASDHFRKENRGILSDPRVRIHIDDGRSHFEGIGKRYDVVISEPSNPWMAGIANLFTKEFFRSVRTRLEPGGIFCQWLQAYSIAPEELKMVARTFQDVFPAASLWAAGEGDFLLIGHRDKVWVTTPAAIHARAAGHPALREAFSIYGGAPVLGLAANYLLGPAELRAFAGSGPRNTDDRPLLEFSAPRSLYAFGPKNVPTIKREILSFKAGIVPPFLADPSLETPGTYNRLGRYLLWRDRPEEAASAFAKASSLGAGVRFDWRKTAWAGPMDSVAAPKRRETFDGAKPVLPMFPRLGSHRPAEEGAADRAVWEGNMEFFAGETGAERGAGTGGGRALKIVSVAGVGSSAYFAPLAVRPSTGYRVEFLLKSGMNPKGIAGAGIAEYDTYLSTGEQPSPEGNRKHLLDAADGVRVSGPGDWQPLSFRFRTSPRTRMVHLVLYREGEHDRSPVYFDDVRIVEEP